MKTLTHFRDGRLFRLHPLDTTFSLIASLVLALLAILLFALSAH